MFVSSQALASGCSKPGADLYRSIAAWDVVALGCIAPGRRVAGQLRRLAGDGIAAAFFRSAPGRRSVHSLAVVVQLPLVFVAHGLREVGYLAALGFRGIHRAGRRDCR
jgi:hypothetical protein